MARSGRRVCALDYKRVRVVTMVTMFPVCVPEFLRVTCRQPELGAGAGSSGYKGWAGGYKGWAGGYKGRAGGYKGWAGGRGPCHAIALAVRPCGFVQGGAAAPDRPHGRQGPGRAHGE